MTRAGGIDLPGEVAGAVAADELVIHGWDLARATGRPYDPDPAALQVVPRLPPRRRRRPDGDGGIFGPVVAVAGGRAAAGPRGGAERAGPGVDAA